MPPKNPSAAKRARQVRIAAKVVAGKGATEIAAEEGHTRQWAHRQIAAAGQVIAGMVEQREARFELLFDRSLDVIDEAFGAWTWAVDKVKGEGGTVTNHPVKIAPDHYARLNAAKRLADLLVAGRTPAKPAEAKPRKLLLEDIEAAIQSSPEALAAIAVWEANQQRG